MYTSGGCNRSQTDGGSGVAAVVIKPVLHSYADEHLLCVICGCSPVACAGDGSSQSQTEAPIDATRVANQCCIRQPMSTRVLVVVEAD